MDPEFLQFHRENPPRRPVPERVRDFRSVEQPMSESALSRQSARCMDCGTPFCHGMGCPLENVAPEINEQVQRGRWRAALDVLLATNPFPEFTGRICPAPCEAACVLGINDEPVAIRALELAVIERGFSEGWMQPAPPSVRRRERVAVVGSGPAGLAAAHALNRTGFHVVVYEHDHRPGGMLRYGIPEYKLEKAVVDRRIRLMEAEGVVFETGVEVGEDVSIRYVQDRFDALVLAGGSRQPRDLAVPGRELDGVHFAMTYLVQQNRLLQEEAVPARIAISARGKAVVVVGGGDTGADCLGTALRQGARSVVQLELLPEPPSQRAPETPWPLWPHRRHDAVSHEEGGERRWSVSTTGFTGGGGKVAELQAVEVEWRTDPKDGKRKPAAAPCSEFSLKCELALLALGFTGPLRNRLFDALALEKDERGGVRREHDGSAGRPGVFVAGDMAAGASLVVRALADGRNVARGVEKYLGE